MIDLKELMEQRSANAPSLDELRMISVSARIDRRRRRVTSAAIAAVVAVAVLVTGLLIGTPAHRSAPQPAATPSVTKINGFSEYADGTHVVASARQAVSAGPLTLTWTPTSDELPLFDFCTFHAPDATQLWLTLKLNGRHFAELNCGSDDRADFGTWQRVEWSRYGAAVGGPVTLTVTVDGAKVFRDGPAPGPSPVAVPADAEIAVAVAQPVEFDAYPLPPRPSVLPSLDVSISGHVNRNGHGLDVSISGHDAGAGRGPDDNLFTSMADVTAPISRQIIWTGSFDLDMASVTPGSLRATVDGVEVNTCFYWSYTLQECSTNLIASGPNQDGRTVPALRRKAGQVVTLTITPEHLSGPWAVRVTPF